MLNFNNESAGNLMTSLEALKSIFPQFSTELDVMLGELSKAKHDPLATSIVLSGKAGRAGGGCKARATKDEVSEARKKRTRITPSLVSIPPEMVDYISGYLPISDLCSLRSTSRDLQAKTYQTFVDKAFRTRHHLVDYHSLDALRSLSDPIYGFNKHIKKLVLGLEKVDISRLRYYTEESRPVADMDDRIGKAEEWQRDNIYLEQHGLSAMLYDILRRTPEVREAVIVADNDGHGGKSWGLSRLRQVTGVACYKPWHMISNEEVPFEPTTSCMTSVFAATIFALVLSKLQLNRLKIDSNYHGVYAPALDFPKCYHSKLKHCFANLKFMDLRIGNLGSVRATVVADFISTAPMLTNLTIATDRFVNVRTELDDDGTMFGAIANTVSLIHLETLRISEVTFCDTDVIRFLGNHKHSLRTLNLDRCTISTEFGRLWQSVFMCIRDHLNLEEFYWMYYSSKEEEQEQEELMVETNLVTEIWISGSWKDEETICEITLDDTVDGVAMLFLEEKLCPNDLTGDNPKLWTVSKTIEMINY